MEYKKIEEIDSAEFSLDILKSNHPVVDPIYIVAGLLKFCD